MVFYPTASFLRFRDVSRCHRDTGNTENIEFYPNSCLSDLSHSMEFYGMHLHKEKLECVTSHNSHLFLALLCERIVFFLFCVRLVELDELD